MRPTPLCAACPERSNPRPRFHQIEVVRDLRGRFLEAAAAEHADSRAVAAPRSRTYRSTRRPR
jgi:hypothetical protein